MSRLPVRIRLTLAFALAMAVVLAATGAFLYLRLQSSLDETVDEGLATRLADVSSVVAGGGSVGRGSPLLADPDESLAQVLDRSGKVIAASRGSAVTPDLTPAELARLETERTVRVGRRDVDGIDGTARLLATTVGTPRGSRVVVVGASLEERDETLRDLLGLLVIGGPVALLLASLLGYSVATAALRPVEAMRAEAAEISAAEPGRRLPVPPARDELSGLARTLNDMLGRLESALERERTFIADASHELRTPLALLKAELELALRRPRSPEELEAALRSASAETDRLVQLSEDLLVLARADQGRLPLRREAVAVRELATDVAARFERQAGSAGRSIDVDVADGLVVTADRLRLEQAVGNLVANALRHGRGPIQLSAFEQNGTVELHVVDEGPGFPTEFLPHAFERFSSADDARTGAGAGLGLAIAEVIAGAHEGSAHAANRNGGGADVWLAIAKA